MCKLCVSFPWAFNKLSLSILTLKTKCIFFRHICLKMNIYLTKMVMLEFDVLWSTFLFNKSHFWDFVPWKLFQDLAVWLISIFDQCKQLWYVLIHVLLRLMVVLNFGISTILDFFSIKTNIYWLIFQINSKIITWLLWKCLLDFNEIHFHIDWPYFLLVVLEWDLDLFKS